ncbi:hypothetical protein H0H87_011920, partial [Tephrocybe sp. NHM501043]
MYADTVDTVEKRTQFDKVELNIEFKRDPLHDPFVDSGVPNFEAQSQNSRDTRSQLTHYTTEIFSRQHRLFTFTLFICHEQARFIRWDRAGAIVSAAFNFHQDPRPLVEFLWRFSHSTPSERGHDPNVRAATHEEANIAREKLKEWAPKKETPIVVFTVPGKDGENREFVAWKSMKSPYSTIGRCTRAYPAYEIATSQYCFLKDGWRAHELDPEATILQELAEKKVENVPIFVCGGDVETEATMTDLYVPAPDSTQSDTNPYPPRRESKWKKAGTKKRITRRIHHRFIVNTIGKPLNTF